MINLRMPQSHRLKSSLTQMHSSMLKWQWTVKASFAMCLPIEKKVHKKRKVQDKNLKIVKDILISTLTLMICRLEIC